MPRTVGIIIHTLHHLTDTGPLCEELARRGYRVVFFCNSDVRVKPKYNPKLHPEHLDTVPHDEVVWYSSTSDLARQLSERSLTAVFTQEAIPFVYEPALFQNRSYPVYSIVHSVDNFHTRAITTNAIDKSFAGYEKYGEYLGWDKKDYVSLGLPKYDVIERFDANAIRKKHHLPEKFILVLVPNNTLLSALVVYKICRMIKSAGYDVILKGKSPKCDKFIYHFFGRQYLLSDVGYYPFVTHELIFASHGVVGFDTTAVEEILMCERPLVNFKIKPYRDREATQGGFKQFVPMWASDFCLDIDLMDHKKLGAFKPVPDFVDHFSKTFDYERIQDEVFSRPGGASKRVVDFMEQHA